MFQELAGKLYEAADQGYRVNPIKVQKILGIPKPKQTNEASESSCKFFIFE